MKRRAFITLLGGDVAARGAGAAVGEATDRWVPGPGHAFIPWLMGGRLCPATARTRLDLPGH